MNYISKRIRGLPYGQLKARGNREAPRLWTEAIVDETRSLPKVSDACILKATLLLPPDKFPVDFPYGPDLDNLLKRLLDALNKTVFSETSGSDSCIVALSAMKTRATGTDEPGVDLEILPVSVR